MKGYAGTGLRRPLIEISRKTEDKPRKVAVLLPLPRGERTEVRGDLKGFILISAINLNPKRRIS